MEQFGSTLFQKQGNGVVFFLCISGVIVRKAQVTGSLAHFSKRLPKGVFSSDNFLLELFERNVVQVRVRKSVIP